MFHSFDFGIRLCEMFVGVGTPGKVCLTKEKEFMYNLY